MKMPPPIATKFTKLVLTILAITILGIILSFVSQDHTLLMLSAGVAVAGGVKIIDYHCDPFNFGEVTLSATGKLEIALVQMVPLAEAELQPHNDEDLEEQDILDRSDVKQWYTQKGIALLSALIDELNVQGHKRLTIKENGDVFVTASGKQQPVDTIPDFPPRPAWEDLCVLAREDDIAAEVCNQELTVSWA